MTHHPKISQKLNRAIMDAVSDAFLELLQERIPVTLDNPPDFWVNEPQLKEPFDLIADAQHKVERNLKSLLASGK